MRMLSALICLFTSLLLSVCVVMPLSAATVPLNRKPLSGPITAAYENVTLVEDTSWHGTIIVKGSLVVSSQTTLRIDPGTVIRFMAIKGSRQLPRLVVMGRIQSIGTAEQPILFAPNHAQSSKGDWGGLQLLSSEKRNRFEYCRIEGAETALEGRFSTVTAKALSITRSTTGCLLRDTIATLIAPNINACDTGLEVHDSELELRDATLAANRRGMLLYRSAVVMSSTTVNGSSQQGIVTDDCRLKFSSCEFSDNAVGAQISGGEGQIFLSRFMRNRETALHLSAARVKISRCQISNNVRDGVKLEDDRAALWGNSISDNGGYNLVYSGRDTLNATQNWWGSSDELYITAKLSAAASSLRAAAVNVFPWLLEKPPIFP